MIQMPIQTEPHQAKAVGDSLRISWKDATEIGRFVKDDDLETAKSKLEKVTEKELEVPYTKYDSGAGHKPGKDQGRYPVKAAGEILDLLENAENNADHQGLNTDKLEIQKFITNQGPTLRTPKRHRGRQITTAHVKLVVGEKE